MLTFHNLSRENKEIIINILKEDKRKKIIISHEEISIPGQKILVTNRGFNYE